MNLKESICHCISDNLPQLLKERENDLSLWKAWSSDPNRKIVVFGASIMCEVCIRHLENLGINVDIICDNNSTRYGEFVTDSGRIIKVVSVDEAMYGDEEKLCFVAAGAHHFSAISKQLKQYKTAEIVLKWHLDLYLETIRMLCVQSTPFMQKIDELLNFYDDEESIRILWEHFFMLFKLEKIPEELKACSMERLCVLPQYFLENGKYLGKQGIMIDCGAFIGDSLEDLVYKTQYIDFDHYDCYELHPLIYEKLLQTLKNLPAEIQGKVRAYDVGVGDYTGFTKAMIGSPGLRNSTVLHNGTEKVKVIKLDDYYSGLDVTFIKMDIEGSEQAALRGAKNVISSCRPACAICVYHTFSAFWEVPQLLKEYVPEYKMILRHHTKDWDDTVCYAKIGEWG